MISFRGGHCDYSPQAPPKKSPDTSPLIPKKADKALAFRILIFRWNIQSFKYSNTLHSLQ